MTVIDLKKTFIFHRRYENRPGHPPVKHRDARFSVKLKQGIAFFRMRIMCYEE